MSDAKQSSWLAALRLTGNDRPTASALHERAELAVIRRLVARLLPGGEDAYWRLVEEELKP